MDESVPKKQKKSWNPENMKTALEAIRNGSKIKTAAKNFNVPESTIRDRLKLGEDYNPPMGRKPTFSVEEEKEMVAFITVMAKRFYGITQQQLRKLAYDFAVAKNIKNIFSSEKGMAGKCWVYSFLKRNPGLSLRLPEPTSLNRVLGFNKSEITIFFANLETLMAKHNFPANRIFNVDETGISNVQKPGKIYAPTGLKQVGKATSAERGQNVTVVCALSATGIYVPPMFIFPRQRVKAFLRIGGPPGAIYECSKSGWINEELFAKWLQHFATNIGAHAQNPALLILDNHCSHQSLSAFEFCRENGIHLLSLPPHTSHKMQPLDVTFYGPLKSAYSRECDLFMKMHPYEKIAHDHLASIFNKAYTRVATMEKAVKGFEVTGIYPLNPHIFDDDDVITSDPIIEEVPSSVQVHQPEGVDNRLIEPIIIGHDESTRSLTPAPSVLDQPKELTPHTPRRQISQNQDIELFAEEPSTDKQYIGNKNESMPSTLDDGIRKDNIKPSTSRRILEDLSPIPQKIIKNQRRIKKQHSIILTSTPLKQQLEEKERKRQIKQMKIEKDKNVKGKKRAKGKSVKRKVLNTSENSEDEGSEKNKNKKLGKGKKKAKIRSKKCISSSEDSEDDVPLAQLCDDDEDDDMENRDICAVCQEFGRDGEIWFRCCRCSNWIHKECSGKDSAKNFLCDFCVD